MTGSVASQQVSEQSYFACSLVAAILVAKVSISGTLTTLLHMSISEEQSRITPSVFVLNVTERQIMTNSSRFAWQKEFVNSYTEFVEQEGFVPYFLEAGVGSGKTRASLMLARELLESGVIDFFVFVCPTKIIRDDCALNESKAVGLRMQTKVSKDRMPAKDYQGCAITYGSLSYCVNVLKTWKENGSRILMIFDEPHHARDDAFDDKSWGLAVSRAIDASKATLGMSGTPFTSTGAKLAGFERCYKGSRFCPDKIFTIENALACGTVREVYPVLVDGMFWYSEATEDCMRIEDVLDPDSIERDDDQEKGYWQKMESACLRSVAKTSEDWFSRTIFDVDEKLDELRKTDALAKALIVVAPGGALKKAPGRICQITGEEPITVSYDDDESESKIFAFNESDSKYIVSVNKISEGVNIPNLRIVVLATTYSTDLAFIQILGRVMRWPGQDQDKRLAWAYMPKTQRNQKRASAWKIRQERAIAIREKKKTSPKKESEGSLPIGFGNIRGDSTTVIDSVEATQEELDWARAMISSRSYQCDDEVLIKIARDFNIEPEKVEVSRGDVEKKKKFHRKESYRVSQRIAYKHGEEFNVINCAINRCQGVKSVDDVHDNYKWEKMKERHDILLDWLTNGIPQKWLN